MSQGYRLWSLQHFAKVVLPINHVAHRGNLTRAGVGAVDPSRNRSSAAKPLIMPLPTNSAGQTRTPGLVYSGDGVIYNVTLRH